MITPVAAIDPGTDRRDRLRLAVVVALLALEVPVGNYAVHLSPPGTHVAAFWPGSGLSVVALVLARPRWRRWTLAGIFLVTVLGNLHGGRPVDVSLGFGLTNVVEAALVVGLLTRGGREQPTLENLDDFIRLTGAAVAGAVAGGMLGGLTVSLVGEGTFWVTARALMSSHAAALLIIPPLALRLPRHRQRPAGALEAGVQWALLAIAATFVFSPGQRLPLVFLPFPLLVWGAARLRPREVTVQLVLFACLISGLTARGFGPFAAVVRELGLPGEMVGTLLQADLVAAALVALPLSLVKTSRLVTLDRLSQSHQMIQNIMDATTGTAILGTDLAGRIEFFNVGAENLTGYRSDEVAGHASVAVRSGPDGRRLITIAVGVEPDPVALEALVEPFLSGFDGNVTGDWELAGKDGQVRTVSLALSRRYGKRGEPVGYLGVADDVTERRRQEALVADALAQEKQLVDRLAQVDQTKNDFLATVSHELRTPITSILGYSQLLLSEGDSALPATHQQVIHRIERNGRRLMGLIEDMLTMSQLEMGDFRFKESVLDLRTVLTGAVEAAGEGINARRIRLETRLAPAPVKVCGDADKLERAFANLLSNAAKFSHEGDAVTVELATEGGEAVVSVSDTGIGISDEDLVHLFDRFFRGADARERAIQGAGLGLTITNSIVAGHRGRIEVESTLGQGTRFTVRLPLLSDESSSVA